jgi:hypothetical protein
LLVAKNVLFGPIKKLQYAAVDIGKNPLKMVRENGMAKKIDPKLRCQSSEFKPSLSMIKILARIESAPSRKQRLTVRLITWTIAISSAAKTSTLS